MNQFSGVVLPKTYSTCWTESVCIHIYIYIYVYIYIYISMYIHIYIYIYLKYIEIRMLSTTCQWFSENLRFNYKLSYYWYCTIVCVGVHQSTSISEHDHLDKTSMNHTFTSTGEEKKHSNLLLFVHIMNYHFYHCTTCICQVHRLCLFRALCVCVCLWVSMGVDGCQKHCNRTFDALCLMRHGWERWGVCVCIYKYTCFMLVCDSLSTCLTKRMLIEYMLLYVVKWNIIRNQRTKNIAATLSASFAGKANLLYGFLIEMTGNNQSWQVGGWATPLKNLTSSIGMIRNSQYYWENKIWENKIDGNQTTNQMSKWIPSWSPWSIDIVLKPIVGHGRQPRIRPSQNKKHKLVLRLIWMFICIYIYILYTYYAYIYIHIFTYYVDIYIYICMYIYIYV